MIKVEYRKHYVAFIDVLGWKEIIARSIVDASVRDGLSEVLRELNEPVDRAAATKGIPDIVARIEATQFSDSVVLSDVVSDYGPFALAHAVQHLCWRLLRLGHLTRGGIVKGDLYHEGPYVLGPALVAAYQLETEVAKYPRVVLSTTIEEELRDPYEVQLGHRDGRYVRDDFDGIRHLHLIDAESNRNIPAIHDRKQSELAQALAALQRKQEDDRRANVGPATLMTIGAKNHWMASYLAELGSRLAL